jgi:hypothetical protein
LVLLFNLCSFEGKAAERIDLSSGIANPSNSGALRENPAALARHSDQIFDFGVLSRSSGDPDFSGIYTGGKSNIGYGIEVDRVQDNFVPAAAFGASTGGFSVGVGARMQTLTSSVTVDAGFRQELKSFVIALVLKNISQLMKDWTLGFGFTPTSWARIGLDFHFQNPNSLFEMNQADTRCVFEVHPISRFSAFLGYQMQILPSLGSMNSGLSAGVNGWVSDSFALYAIYHPIGYDYRLGIKLKLGK